MTDAELIAAGAIADLDDGLRIRVTGGDYSYEGWLSVVFVKKSNAVRCVVEDDCGRLFIHNAGQIGLITEKAYDAEPPGGSA